MYIGKTPTVGNFQVCDAISVVNGQAAYTLQVGGVNVAPESANHMLVSLNGILQKPGSSFTISGSTMTFASNLATGDVIDFVQILGNVLDIGQPSDDTVTAAKLNNDIISGQTALGAEPADTDEFLVSDAGTLKRVDYSYIKDSGGIAMAQMWRINSSTTATSTLTDLTANWEVADTAPTSALGTGLTESSGIFSFPSTGYYWIGCTVGMRKNVGTRNASIQLRATTNNSSYSSIAIGECNNSDFGGTDNTSMSAYAQYMFDITDTTNQKFKLAVAAGSIWKGVTTSPFTGSFLRYISGS